jgi:putative membrane protein
MQTVPNTAAKDKIFMPIIIALSIVIPIVVTLLMYMPRSQVVTSNGVITQFQPLFHAILNGLKAFFLLLGLYFIKGRKINLHRISMLTAFALSSIFLVSYVVYHYNVPSAKFGGIGAIRSVYFFILITHILLAGAIIPLALITIYRSFTAQYEKHKKLARYTFPIWLYVAVTGVVVYLMMSPYYILKN